MIRRETILDQDGKVEYFTNFIPKENTSHYFRELREEIVWSQDELIMFGKRITMRRESAWFADSGKSYKYAGINREGLPWCANLKSLKQRVEDFLQVQFNSCLANYYFDGKDGMGFHTDNEKMLDPNQPIASISLGSERTFRFQHQKTKLKKEILLQDGSLLVMYPPCQEYWKHALPKTKDSNKPRINLTFRKVLNS